MLTRTTIGRSPSSNGGVRVARIRAAACSASAGIGLLDDDRELVAAEPGDGVAGAGHDLEPLGDGHEQLVALGVAEPVVDGLEVVEVQEQDRGRSAPRPARARA